MLGSVDLRNISWNYYIPLWSCTGEHSKIQLRPLSNHVLKSLPKYSGFSLDCINLSPFKIVAMDCLLFHMSLIRALEESTPELIEMQTVIDLSAFSLHPRSK